MNNQSEALRLAHLLELDKWPDAATELRHLYARVQELESIERQLCEQADIAANAYRELESEAEQNAKIIGASAEKELALRTQVEALEAALAASISLLQKTPKIMQNIYVGKDSQSWGAQAKAVLDTAIAAQAKKGGEA